MKMFIFGLVGDSDIVYQVIAESKGDAYEMLHRFEPSIPLRTLINDYECTEEEYKGTVLKHDFTKPMGGNCINDFLHYEYEDFDDSNPTPAPADEDFDDIFCDEPIDFGDYDNDIDIDDEYNW